MSNETNMRNLIEKVKNEIVENIKDDYSSIRTHNIELAVVEDDFLLKEKEDYYSRNFYMKVNRSTYEVTKLELGAKYSLAEINNFCDRVVTNLVLKKDMLLEK